MRWMTMALCLALTLMAGLAHGGGYRDLRPGPPVLELSSFFESTLPEPLYQLPPGTLVVRFPCAVPAAFAFADRSVREYMLPSEARVVVTELRRDKSGAYYQLLYLLSDKQRAYADRFAYPIFTNCNPVYVPDAVPLVILERGAPSARVAPTQPSLPAPSPRVPAPSPRVPAPSPRVPAPSPREQKMPAPDPGVSHREKASVATESVTYFPHASFELEGVCTGIETALSQTMTTGTYWFLPYLGATAAAVQESEDPFKRVHRGWLGGVSFRSDQFASVEAKALLGATRLPSGKSQRTAQLDAEASIGVLRSGFRLSYLDNKADEVWARTRLGIAVVQWDASELQLGGQYVNLRFTLVPREGYYYVSKVGARYNQSRYGGYGAYRTTIAQHFPVSALIGAGKGSVKQWDYVEAELRVGLEF